MEGFDERARRRHKVEHHRLAVVTMGVKLGNETRGYTRFRKLSEMLVEAGFEVDLITTSFQHWEKEHRDVTDPAYREHPFNVVFIDEPGYTKNVDLKRVKSHKEAAQNLSAYFAADPWRYDLIYSEVPPNDVARACGEAAKTVQVPFIVDINDLWPEAMFMAVDIPVLSKAFFKSFTRDAHAVYQMLDAAVGTSDEYALRPAADRDEPYPHITVYVGNDLDEFDAGVRAFAADIDKPDDELWVAYAGTLGASYDLETLIRAAALNATRVPNLRTKILGDGPERAHLESLAAELGAPVEFLGYVDYAHMAAYLSRCDMVVNSLKKAAVQSIVTKIGDYLASGASMVNTGSSFEFRNKVTHDGFGLNVEAENPEELAHTLRVLARNTSMRKIMGAKGRAIAEKEFNQSQSYQEIVNLIKTMLV